MTGYPAWICAECGERLGSTSKLWSTWHEGICGWCGDPATVTEPRDFGYPPAPRAPSGSGEQAARPLPITTDAIATATIAADHPASPGD